MYYFIIQVMFKFQLKGYFYLHLINIDSLMFSFIMKQYFYLIFNLKGNTHII
jgi:hypothetical protein